MAWGDKDTPAFGDNDTEAFTAAGFGANDMPAFGDADTEAFPQPAASEGPVRDLLAEQRTAGNVDATGRVTPQAEIGAYRDSTDWGTRNLVRPLERGLHNLGQGVAAGQMDKARKELDALDRLDRGEQPDNAHRGEYLLFKMLPPEQRTRIRAERERSLGVNAGLVVEHGAAAAAVPQSPVVSQVEKAKGWGDAWDAFSRDPLTYIGNMSLESGPQSAVSMVGAIAAARAGGRAGGTQRIAAGAGVGSGLVEYASALVEGMQQNGINVQDPAAIQAATADPVLWPKIQQHAETRGAVVGAFDAATMGLAGKTFAPKALTGKAAQLVNIPTQAVVQGVGGAAGEAAATVATGGTITPHALMGEFFGEFGSAPVDVAITTLGKAQAKDNSPAPREFLTSGEISDQRAAESQAYERALAQNAIDALNPGNAQYTQLPEPAPAPLAAPEAVATAALVPAETTAPFTASQEWQEVPAGAEVQPGLDIRMDPATGRRWARVRPSPAAAPPTQNLSATIKDARPAEEIAVEHQQQAEQSIADEETRALSAFGVAKGGRVAMTYGDVTAPVTVEEAWEEDGSAWARLRDDEGTTYVVQPGEADFSLIVGDGSRAAPVQATTATHVDEAAKQTAEEPTEAQKAAGNYRKGHVKVHGLDVAIENAKGSTRAGVDPNGQPWSVEMPTHYGYVKRTTGADGDQVDVYLGPSPDSDKVFVVDQIDHTTGEFDEHKVMLGYPDSVAAMLDYQSAFSDGRGMDRAGSVTPMTMAEFKAWLSKGNTKKPLTWKKKADVADTNVGEFGANDAEATFTDSAARTGGASPEVSAEQQPEAVGGPSPAAPNAIPPVPPHLTMEAWDAKHGGGKPARGATAENGAVAPTKADFDRLQVTQMTDEQLEQAKAFYPPEHNRTKAIAREQKRRATAASSAQQVPGGSIPAPSAAPEVAQAGTDQENTRADSENLAESAAPADAPATPVQPNRSETPNSSPANIRALLKGLQQADFSELVQRLSVMISTAPRQRDQAIAAIQQQRTTSEIERALAEMLGKGAALPAESVLDEPIPPAPADEFPDEWHRRLYEFGRARLEGRPVHAAERHRLWAAFRGFVAHDPDANEPFSKPADVDLLAEDYARDPGGYFIDRERLADWIKKTYADGTAKFQQDAPQSERAAEAPNDVSAADSAGKLEQKTAPAAQETAKRNLRPLPVSELTDEEAREEYFTLQGDLGADYGYARQKFPDPGTKGWSELQERKKALAERLGRLPWQRTADEVKSVERMPVERHRRFVEEALAAGKDVPERVMADYPDLIATDERATVEYMLKRAKETGLFTPERLVRRNTGQLVIDGVNKDGSRRHYAVLRDPDGQHELGERLLQVSSLKEGKFTVMEEYGGAEADAVVSPTEFPLDLARSAYEGISHTPERRAEQERAEFVRDVQGLHARLAAMAETDDQKKVLAEQIARYKAGYLEKRGAVLAAQSRVMSSMIVGPANFPVERNKKRMATEMRRTEEFSEWRIKTQKAAERAIMEARSGEQVAAAEWDALRKDIDSSIAVISRIDIGAERGFDRTAFVNSIKRKIEVRAERGDAEIVRRALEHVRAKQTEMAKPIFAERNSIWALTDQASSVDAAPAPTGTDSIVQYDGVEVVNNRDAERVQILFDGKPSAEVITSLKKAGWRWSPANSAWQRQNTNAAAYSATSILDKFYTRKATETPAMEPTEAAQEEVAEPHRPATERDTEEVKSQDHVRNVKSWFDAAPGELVAPGLRLVRRGIAKKKDAEQLAGSIGGSVVLDGKRWGVVRKDIPFDPAEIATIPAQESAKRALEMAAVGNHPVEMFGDGRAEISQLADSFPSIGGDRATIGAKRPDMFVEVYPAEADRLISPPGESSAAIRARVERARELLPKVEPEFHHEAEALLREAERHNLPTDGARRVAPSLAAMDGSTLVRRIHVAEALSYVRLGIDRTQKNTTGDGKEKPNFQRADGQSPQSADEIEIAKGLMAVPAEAFTQHEAEIVQAVNEIAKKIIPEARLRVYAKMRATEETGQAGEVLGAHWRTREAKGIAHVIAWSLETPNARDTVRHEAIHYLRSVQLLDDQEYGRLRQLAEREGWIGRHEIEARYHHLDHAGQIEEAIADQFAKWRQDSGAKVPAFIRPIFNRIRLFLDRVADAARRILGKEATVDDIFSRIERGEVGRRGVIKEIIRDTTAVDFAHPDTEKAAAEALSFLIRRPPPSAGPAVPGEDNSLMPDAGWLKRMFIHPRTIAALHKAFVPVYRTAEKQFETRDEVAAALSRMIEPYTSLTPEQKRKVNAVLELGRLQGTVVRANQLLAVRNTGHPEARLSTLGEIIRLSAAEQSGYKAVRTAMDAALDLFKQQVIRERGLDPAAVKTARDIEALANAATTPAEQARLTELAQTVRDIEQAKRQGYIPFQRWGQVGIIVKKDTGTVDPSTGEIIKDTVWFEMIEVDGLMDRAERWVDGKLKRPTNFASMPKVAEALNAAKRKYQNKPGHEIKVVQIAPNTPMASQVHIADLDMLAQVAQLDPVTWDSVKDAFDTAIMKRSFRSHFFGAKNTPGYSGDFERAIADYVVGISGYLARRRFSSTWEKAIEAIPRAMPKLKEYAQKYHAYIQNPAEEFFALRQIGFVWYLAGSVATAMVNLTQVPIITAPYLTQFHGKAGVVRELTRAYRDALKMMTKHKGMDIFDPSKAPADVAAALQQAWDEGFFVPLNTWEVMGLAHNRSPALRGLSKKARTAVDAIAIMFTMAERMNRLVTFIAAYRLGRNPTVKAKARQVLAGNALARSGELLRGFTPEKFAEWVIDETHYRMGKVNRPTVMRGAGAALMQFKGFVMQTLELFYRLGTQNGRDGKRAMAMMLLMLWMFSGNWGLPFADDITDLLELLSKKFGGVDLDIRTEVRELVVELTGSPKLAEVLGKGGGRLIGMDLSRIGMGHILPHNMEEVGGIPASMTVGRLSQAMDHAKHGDTALAVGELLPTFAKNIIHGLAWGSSGVRSQASGKMVITPEEVTVGQQMLKAIGFTPAEISNRRESEYAQQRANKAVAEVKADFYGRLARLYADQQKAQDAGDKERVVRLGHDITEVQDDLNAFNAGRPDHEQVKIDRKQMQAKIREELMGARARDKGAPKAARGRRERIDAIYGTTE